MWIKFSAIMSINEKGWSEEVKVSLLLAFVWELLCLLCTNVSNVLGRRPQTPFLFSQTPWESRQVLAFAVPRGTVCRHAHTWQSFNRGPKQTWHLGLALTFDTDDQGSKPLPLGLWLSKSESGDSNTTELSRWGNFTLLKCTACG